MSTLAALYLDLLKRHLTRIDDPVIRPVSPSGWKQKVFAPVQQALGKRGMAITYERSGESKRADGRDWPPTAETMIGLARLDNLQHCIETALRDRVPGDVIETGVWRGGASIFARAVLAAHGVTDRTVWVADSFQGLPEPDSRFPADAGDTHSTHDELAVSAEEVRANFKRYDMLDDQVRFLEGWFADTLPTAPVEQLAVVRLDGDMYGSTWDAISVLYPKLSPGGFLIVDDYALEGCRRAITDYRAQEQITEPIETIDHMGSFWRRDLASTTVA